MASLASDWVLRFPLDLDSGCLVMTQTDEYWGASWALVAMRVMVMEPDWVAEAMSAAQLAVQSLESAARRWVPMADWAVGQEVEGAEAEVVVVGTVAGHQAGRVCRWEHPVGEHPEYLPIWGLVQVKQYPRF